MSSESAVRTVLEREAAKAEEIRSELALADLATPSIGDFFPDLPARVRGNQWCSSSNNIKLPHLMILSAVPIVDIRPMSPEQFKNTYHMDADAATAFTEAGLLLPNIIVRDSSKWAHCDYMTPLIDRSLAIGEQSDAFFELRRPGFQKHLVPERRSLVRSVLNAGIPAELGGEPDQHPDSLSKALGTRLAYLDVLEPEIAEFIVSTFNRGDHGKAFDILNTAKHFFASPTTAALGGEVTWDEYHYSSYKRAKLNLPNVVPALTDVRISYDLLEWVVYKFAGVAPLALAPHHADKLLKILLDDEFQKAKQQFRSQLQAVSTKMHSQDITESTLADLIDYFNSMKDRIDRVIGCAHDAVGVLRYTAGVAVSSCLPLFFGAMVDRIFERIEKATDVYIRECFRSPMHRLLFNVDRFAALADRKA